MGKILLLIAALSALAAGPAFAHARLESADPKVGATVAAAPARIRLKFSEVIRLGGSGVMLTGPDGHGHLLQPLTQDPADVRAVLAPTPTGLQPGRYKVEWRALSSEGHHTQGDFTFTIAP